jgi:hypothetical protein
MVKGHAQAAFEVLSGGYAQKFDPQGGWQQVTGAKAANFARAHAAQGSRRERHFFRAAVARVISIPGIKKLGAEVILLRDRHRHEPVPFRRPPPVVGLSVSAQR